MMREIKPQRTSWRLWVGSVLSACAILVGAATAILAKYAPLTWLWSLLVVAGALVTASSVVLLSPWWEQRSHVRMMSAQLRQKLDRPMEEHFEPRSRGVAQQDWQGWYFTGRTSALRELVAWLSSSPAEGGKLRVVTGGPGAGKSAVLGRLVVLADPARRAQALDSGGIVVAGTVPPLGSIDVRIHARGRTSDEVLTAIAQAVGVSSDGVQQLLGALRRRSKPFTIIIDALDEALDPDDLVRSVVRPLLWSERDIFVRLLIGTRPRLVPALGATDDQVLNLDNTAYFERADLASYVQRLLMVDGDPTAFTPYRTRPAEARRALEELTG